MTSVRTQGGDTKYFPLTIGLHHGSILSSYLFTIVLDLFRNTSKNEHQDVCFSADDIVLRGELKDELNGRLETSLRNI